jgi:restriction system protein
MSANKKMYMVRAGERGYLFEGFKNKNVVAIGGSKAGDLSNATSKEKIKELYRRGYPDDTEGEVNCWCGMLRRFMDDLHKGDYIVTYNRESRQYLIGEIAGDYAFNAGLLDIHHTRSVRWREKQVNKDALSPSTQRSLGPPLPLFEVNDDARAEILKNFESDTR